MLTALPRPYRSPPPSAPWVGTPRRRGRGRFARSARPSWGLRTNAARLGWVIHISRNSNVTQNPREAKSPGRPSPPVIVKKHEKKDIGTQGNRISKLSDKLGQVFVIPACELELSTQGRLGVVLSHDIESHVAQDGEIVGSIVEAISGLILVHNDVEAPMEPIFDAPMGTHYIREALGGQGCAEKVIGCLSRGLGGEFTDADDFADGRQSGPLMPLLEPSDIGR